MRNLPFKGENGVVFWVNRTLFSEAVIPMGRRSGQKKYRKLEVAGSMHGMQGTYNNIFGNNTFHPIRELSWKRRPDAAVPRFFVDIEKKFLLHVLSCSCIPLFFFIVMIREVARKILRGPRKVPLLWREALLVLSLTNLSFQYFPQNSFLRGWQ